ncbi:hypothetical protein LTR37_009904 [Vermiconidia calcicola]|uniref:Uncharacterized protein n=1 Tax=Vermiconidia calcicola TaxID=1690605 RepID=A0ACC3N6V5_9PEZI|nr:hypothetical protein LTR37_009904 [Vermiconidia calcicola]
MSNSLVLGLKNYLSSGKFSVLTITCDGKEFNVHKLVIDAASPVLHNLLDGRPKVRRREAYAQACEVLLETYTNLVKEATENQSVIELKDDPEALQALVHYLYNFVYCDSFIEGNKAISFAVKVYAIADKYQVEDLQALAAQRFKNGYRDFIATIALIEENTNPEVRTLWDIIIPAIKNNITYLLTSDQFQRLVFEQKDLCLSLLGLLVGDEDVSSMEVVD